MRATRSRFAVATLAFALAPAAVAQVGGGSPLIPREVLFGNPVRAAPQISPDGKLLGYLAPVNGVLNVWVRTIGMEDDRAITNDTKRGIRNFTWQYDNAHVLYTQDVGGDENWRLYQTDIATKETKDLTPFDKVRVDIVAYDSKSPDTILVQMNRRDPTLFDVYAVDLTRDSVALTVQNPGDVSAWQADNAFQIRAAQAQTKEGATVIRVRNDATSPWRDLVVWGPEETFGAIAGFSPDNKALWVITSLDANAARLLEIDIATGKRRVLASDPQFDVADLVTQPRTHALQAVVFIKQRNDYLFVDQKLRADWATLRAAHAGDFVPVSRDISDDRWIVQYVSDDAPVYWYLYDRTAKKNKTTLLFSNRPQLEHFHLAKMTPVQFRARDGMTLYGYLTTPYGVPARQLPMVLWVHGGPWARDVWGLDRWVQWLANRGYAVLQVNFRGSTGYGKKYVNAGDRQWAGSMRTDLLDGMDYMVKRGIADPKLVCIMGGSYGGYAVLAGLAFQPDAYACGVDIVGPSNLNTLLQTIPPYWATIVSMFKQRMGDTDSVLTAQSPLFKADAILAPLLIGQGANDPRVKRAESDQMVAAMRRSGKTVTYYVFPDEGHGFARPVNVLAFNAAAENFLAKYLGGRAEAPTTAESDLLYSVKQ